MSVQPNDHQNMFVDNVIHVGSGFLVKEHRHVVETLSSIVPRLARWSPRDVDVDVSLQDRAGAEQRVTLRTVLPGLPALVAVASNPDITRALCDAKRELIRQIERQKSEHEPMNRPRLKQATIRHPGTSEPRAARADGDCRL